MNNEKNLNRNSLGEIIFPLQRRITSKSLETKGREVKDKVGMVRSAVLYSLIRRVRDSLEL